MSASVTNQTQMRSKIFSGSPKKNAAWRSFSNMKVGTRPGLVITCQNTNSSTRMPNCQKRSVAARGLIRFHMGFGFFFCAAGQAAFSSCCW